MRVRNDCRVLLILAVIAVAVPAAAQARERDDLVVRRLAFAEASLERLDLQVRIGADRELMALGSAPAIELAELPVSAMGWLAPVSTQSPDERLVVYNSITWFRDFDPVKSYSDNGIRRGDVLNIPVLRVHDTRTGEERVLEEGAHSAVWSADGALAYVRGVTREDIVGEPYLGHVFVRESIDAEPEQWTTEPATYIVAGWAGRRPIVYTKGAGESLTIYALDGPGKKRLLAEHGSVVAISPDGDQVFVEHSSRSPLVHVLNVADGTEAARYSLREVAAAVGERKVSITYAGSWVGDRVVASGSMGLVVFNVRPDAIAVERILEVDREMFPFGLTEPRLIDGGRRIVARTYLGNPEAGPTPAMVLDCDARSGQCRGARAPGRVLHATHRANPDASK